MSIFQALILGLVQGLSEFLPISSSGHLVAVPIIFGWNEHPLVFDTTLHLGTAAALLIYFWKDLWAILFGFLKDVSSKKLNIKSYSDLGMLALFILVGCIPAGILGVLFDDAFESYFRGALTVSIFLTLGSLLMILAEKVSKKNSQTLSFKKSIFVGIMQALALFPGVSRSGATISGGLLLNLDRETAAKFSFLLSFPIVVMAGMFKLLTSYNDLLQVSAMPLIVGFLASALSGVLAISFLMKFLKKNSLAVFIIYRFILALLLIVFFR